jgi:hypothetical protein
MLVYELLAFVFLGTVNAVTSIAMKVQVNRTRPEDERFSWWVRDFSDVRQSYQELSPSSPLPNIAKYSGWSCLALILVMILGSFFGK